MIDLAYRPAHADAVRRAIEALEQMQAFLESVDVETYMFIDPLEVVRQETIDLWLGVSLVDLRAELRHMERLAAASLLAEGAAA